MLLKVYLHDALYTKLTHCVECNALFLLALYNICLVKEPTGNDTHGFSNNPDGSPVILPENVYYLPEQKIMT